MTSFKKAIGFIGACSLMASCGFSLGEENTWDVTQPIETGVTVEATGSVKVVPDAVQFNFSVFAIDMTSSIALERATGLASQAREALDEAKIDNDDIATRSVSIYPEYSYSQDGKQNLIGFRATQSFAVTLRDTTSAGEVVDAVVASVGTDLSIDTLSPILIDSKDASEQARESAIKLAKKKAEDYADLLGVDLGNVISLREFATSGATSQPWLRADLAVGESSKTVVDLGTQEVSVTVEARWALASDN
ncbi:MAG: SIMPL domain-containing protein [Acidimicrobiaceae bacterium]